MTKVNNK